MALGGSLKTNSWEAVKVGGHSGAIVLYRATRGERQDSLSSNYQLHSRSSRVQFGMSSVRILMMEPLHTSYTVNIRSDTEIVLLFIISYFLLTCPV